MREEEMSPARTGAVGAIYDQHLMESIKMVIR